MSNPITNRFVPGPFGEVGYLAKKPGYGISRQHVFEDASLKDLDAREKQRELDKMKRHAFNEEFWAASDLRSLYSRVNRFVELGMEAHDKDLEHKRNRLKVIMLDEQSKLPMEYTDKAQKSAERVFESKKKKAEEVQKIARDAQKSFVEKEYDRIFKQNCDELRTRMERENRVALNEIHKAQMCEKLMVEELEKEEDKIWSAMWDKENEKLQMRSNKERARLKQFSDDYLSGLEQQIRDTNYRKVNEECVERLEESWRREIQDMKELEYEKRGTDSKQREERMSRDLVQQLEANKLLRERKMQEEKYLDKLMIDADSEAYRDEQAAAVDNRCQLRSELAIFRESLKQYNDARDAYEKEMELTCEAQKRAIEAKRRESKRRSTLAKQELMQKCVEGRKQQMEERKAEEAELKKKDQEEAEFLKFRREQNEALDAAPKYPGQMWGKPQQYWYVQASKVNEEQMKYAQLLKKREELDAQEVLTDMRKQKDETERKIDELLKSPLQLRGGSDVHPFLPPLLAAKK